MKYQALPAKAEAREGHIIDEQHPELQLCLAGP